MVLNILAPFKAIESFAYCRSESSDPDTTLLYRVKANGRTNVVTFVVTKNKKLYQAGMRAEVQQAPRE